MKSEGSWRQILGLTNRRLQDNRNELLQSIRDGRYKPSPVRRKEIPKPDESGVRKLGIPAVIDRVIQQAKSQQLQPLFKRLFSDGGYGYRPGRNAQQAIRKVKDYAEQGYRHAVEIDLFKYFDTLNHELLMNLLRKQIQDERVTNLIKKYLEGKLKLRMNTRKSKVVSVAAQKHFKFLGYVLGKNKESGYWRIAGSAILERSITNEKLA